MQRRATGVGLASALLVVLLGVVARAEVSPWGKSAVFIKGKWTPFDEDDEAGVPQPYPPKTDSWARNETTVMVSISSFRDFRCPKTLYNLFTYVHLCGRRGKGRCGWAGFTPILRAFCPLPHVLPFSSVPSCLSPHTTQPNTT